MVDCIGSLGASHVVGFRAHSADAIGQDGDLFNLTSHTKTLKTTQLWYLEICVRYVTFSVKENFNFSVAFQPGYGIYRNAFHRLSSSS
jgi:hypothetical protein